MFRQNEFNPEGLVESNYQFVKEAFQLNFHLGEELSAQLVVVHRGKIVVDLWGSVSDPNYDGDSLQTVWSSTKNLASLGVAMMVDRGLLQYGDKITKHWAEYDRGQKGKGEMTIADILRHEGGMPAFSQQMNIEDCYPENINNNNVGKIIEDEELKYPHGEYRREYHALTRGLILQEVFRRVEPDNNPLGQFLGENVFRKLGVGVHMGLRPEEQETLKIADCIALSRKQVLAAASEAGRDDIVRKVLEMPEESTTSTQTPILRMTGSIDVPFWNLPKVREAEIPSRGGLASARGLAVIAGHLARGGGDLLSRGAWQKMHQNPTPGFLLGGRNTEFTQGGVNHFTIGHNPTNIGCGQQTSVDEEADTAHLVHLVPGGMYGWVGYGGSLHLWDPAQEIGFAYVPTYLAWYDKSWQRAIRCLEALYQSLADREI